MESGGIKQGNLYVTRADEQWQFGTTEDNPLGTSPEELQLIPPIKPITFMVFRQSIDQIAPFASF